MHVAVRRGHAKLLTHLLFSSGDPNARSVRDPKARIDGRLKPLSRELGQVNGTTPLHLAVVQGRRDLVESLLLAGANPLLRDVRSLSAPNTGSLAAVALTGSLDAGQERDPAGARGGTGGARVDAAAPRRQLSRARRHRRVATR